MEYFRTHSASFLPDNFVFNDINNYVCKSTENIIRFKNVNDNYNPSALVENNLDASVETTRRKLKKSSAEKLLKRKKSLISRLRYVGYRYLQLGCRIPLPKELKI